jgi:heme/copper-type cytochrome/quinol oxidase subunit 2
MSENQAEKLARWEKIRASGRSHFIWMYGVLRFGVPMAVMMSLLSIIRQPSAILDKLGIALIVCLAGGYALGIASWQINEMRYLRASTQETPYNNKELALAALRSTWWFFALVIVLAIGQLPLYKYSRLLALRYELHQAREQWRVNGPLHYH